MSKHILHEIVRPLSGIVVAILLCSCGTSSAAVPAANLPTAVVARIPYVQKTADGTPEPLPTSDLSTAAPSETSTAGTTTHVAVIGDYGSTGTNEAKVAALVESWKPDYIVTTGDNNYPNGGADTIDANIGQYYHAYIGNYKGKYGQGASENRFFPVLGNHDWIPGNVRVYTDYFTLPGNERYYTVDLGPTRFFMVDSMPGDEPDGTDANSKQAAWLKQGLADSTACTNVVVFHHAPFSSGLHGSSGWMQWPFAAWGADMVLSGHDHSYERFQHDGIPYIVNGLGGGALYQLHKPIDGSQLQFQGQYGAMLLEINRNTLRYQFITVDGKVVDDQTITGGCQ